MVEKCKPVYKNVNSVKSFSDQRAATVQVMNRICENDEYLYQQSEKLSYLSPPANRRRFNPPLVDDSQSYGYTLGSDNNVYFSSTLNHLISIDFQDLSMVDENKSNCDFESYMDSNGDSHHRAIVPHKNSSSLNTDCKNWDLEEVNSAWYVGFNKNKDYHVRPDWIKDNFDPEIPGICRAQTIVIPNGIESNASKTSYLEAVTLKIENNGKTNNNWASPLYVQLWNVESKNVPRTVWRNNQNVSVSGYDTIYVPKGNPYTALATSVFYPDVTTPSNFTFVFDKPVKVTAGEHYAIVILSPLSHWDHCPRIGGWGRNCTVKKDNGGDAFLSEDNGRTWIRYGRNDDKVAYKLGKRTPQDFAFQCHIREYDEGFETDTDYYLYLKPIIDNPIESLYITSPICKGNETEYSDLDLEFEVSCDGRNWIPVPSNNLVIFSTDENGDYPNTAFVRAKLSTATSADSPYIESMNIIVNNKLPKQMYVRTHFYNPKLTPMLGANIWGRVYAPFESIPSNVEDVDCKVEIIQETLSKEHFHIVTVDELNMFTELIGSDGEPILDVNKVNDDSDSVAKYLIDNPSVIKELKQQFVYVKPYNLRNTEYLMSFEDFDSEGNSILGGLKLSNSPAYPIQECVLLPLGTERVQSLGEWYDYNVNYDSDILVLTREILDDLPVGSLSVGYNKVFIQDLTVDEVGDYINSETGLSEKGLILDYYKEEIFISDRELETRKVPLRMVPLDPIREVKIIRDDEETLVYEDVDYTVDYINKELVFPNTNINDENSVLKLNDTISIVYTPNLPDTGIAIGYRATRTDLTHQLKIKPNFIEYK